MKFSKLLYPSILAVSALVLHVGNSIRKRGECRRRNNHLANVLTLANNSTESSNDNKTATSATVSSHTTEFQITDNQAYRHRQERRDRWKLAFEIGTFFVVSTYTAVTYNQWQTMKETLRMQHRAYLLLAANDGMKILYIRVGQPMMVNVHLENRGQSPAIDVIRVGEIEIGPDAMKHIRKIKIPENTTEPSFAALPQGETNFFTVTSKTLVQEVLTEFVVFGTVVYKDIFGDRHETYFCAYNSLSAWERCPNYDRIN